ncbi:hypothetical protein [Polaribacter sp. KT 15]|uniref:hypothetical protein n=1 Tax=Polaribacter sp. KT 15 TaxID=1896175 RepID=UPI00090C1F65|nr:hypothetical protein [Polaribacter sp. KT 15]SHM72458.1 hypothetical protein SAMN05720268_0187 [Polaribacter sp. KT 15]
MKKINIIFVFILSITFLNTKAQEKKINFNKGTLKICSSKSFIIEGYDGDEVIIESLHQKNKVNFKAVSKKSSKSNKAGGSVFSFKGVSGDFSKKKKKKWVVTPGDSSVTFSDKDSTIAVKEKTKKISYSVSGAYTDDDKIIKPKTVFFKIDDPTRKDGLKRLGKKEENSELAIYFTIEKKGDELIFKDKVDGNLIMTSYREQYKIKIPNSLHLNWTTSCNTSKKNSNHFFFNSEKSSLSNFDGEVEISSSVSNINLKDVTGPVSINSIGGNVTIEFDKKMPKELYSIYSNNGFIDITLPSESSLNLDANASDIFTDIDFKILEEKELDNLQKMKLKLNSGKVLMKLNAGLGNIYLRKK